MYLTSVDVQKIKKERFEKSNFSAQYPPLTLKIEVDTLVTPSSAPDETLDLSFELDLETSILYEEFEAFSN